ncbi:rhomboid family intramembrane serine protease [Streptomyces sp. CA-132043]|uniref:rhomboid family intramembrane serine protease n=1 Tax=Streptomyces sp. CA-132043 TaxID=3240048 RepID=UPI003D9231C5
MGARAKPAALLVLAWAGLLWVLEVVDVASGHALDTFGIRPRELSELIDVVPATAVHFGFAHLMANTLPLLVLGFLAGLRTGVRRLAGVVLLIAVVSGLGVWLISPPGSNTAGVSGVIFGLFGYLVVRGFIERKALDIAIGLLVAVLYGSLLWGALPAADGISWQAHLFGLAGGVLAAYAFRARTPALRSPGGVP